MTSPDSALGEPYEDLLQQREAATLGIWTFLATEILFFGAMFLSYIVYRHAYPLAFAAASQHTLIAFGTINTAILLTSSFTVAMSLHAAQAGRWRAVLVCLALTILFALAFLTLKGFEYAKDLEDHLWPGRHFRGDLPPEAQIFWFLYWLMTGVHGLHVLIGIGLLSTMAWLTHRRRFTVAYHIPLEITALYWHFVDVIWIFLYPLLYLIHRYSS